MQIEEKLNEILTDILPEDEVFFEVHDGYVNFALRGKYDDLSAFDVEWPTEDIFNIPGVLVDMAELIENVAKPAIKSNILDVIKEGYYEDLDEVIEDCENISKNADYAIKTLNEKAREIEYSIFKDDFVR